MWLFEVMGEFQGKHLFFKCKRTVSDLWSCIASILKRCKTYPLADTKQKIKLKWPYNVRVTEGLTEFHDGLMVPLFVNMCDILSNVRYFSNLYPKAHFSGCQYNLHTYSWYMCAPTISKLVTLSLIWQAANKDWQAVNQVRLLIQR